MKNVFFNKRNIIREAFKNNVQVRKSAQTKGGSGNIFFINKKFLREGIKRVLPNLKHAINVNNHLCLKVYLDYNFSFSAAIFSFSPINEHFRMSNSPIAGEKIPISLRKGDLGPLGTFPHLNIFLNDYLM